MRRVYLSIETHALAKKCAQTAGISIGEWVSAAIESHAMKDGAQQRLALLVSQLREILTNGKNTPPPPDEDEYDEPWDSHY